MRRHAEDYVRVLEEEGLKHSGIREMRDGDVYVEFGMQTDTTKIKIMAIFDGDSEVCSVRCFSVARVPEEKFGQLLMLCNDLNREYKFMKFLIDDDNDLNIEEDALLDDGTAGKEAFTLVAQLIRIVDKVYPRIMKEMYS